MKAFLKNIKLYLVIILLCVVGFSCCNSTDSCKKDITITKIWDNSPHNAFTDLIKFNGIYYCSYSEEYSSSIDTAGSIGGIRIIRSKTGKNWESVDLIQKKGVRLCNPRLSITPDRQIMIIMDGFSSPLVSFSDKKGDAFSDPESVNVDRTIITGKNRLWKVTWFRGTGYALFYTPDSKNDRISLLKTIDGKNFEKVIKIEANGLLDESTLRFDQNGTMYAIINNLEKGKRVIVGKSNWPYTKWSYLKIKDVPDKFNYTIMNKNIIMVATGLFKPEIHTGVLTINKKGFIEEILKIPLVKDVCYPGIIKESGKILISCCSKHEGKPAIYLIKVSVKRIKRDIH